MAIKNVLMIGNQLLREMSSDVTDFDSELPEIVQDLEDTLIHLQRVKKIGRALAAPQIGYMKKVIFINTPKNKIVMVNPVITWKSDEMFEVWDSCFSFDVSFFVKVKRHKFIEVEYQELTGEKIIKKFNSDFSELLQHEIDHLYGVLATDYVQDPKDIIMRSEWEKSKSNKKRIGILGGISYQSTIKYYELIHKKYFEQAGDYYYPEVVIYSLNFQKFTDIENNKDYDGYIQYVMDGIRSLQNSNVDFIIMAANSPHSVFEEVKKLADIDLLSIVEATAKFAKKEKLKKLLLLGIEYTMQSSFYSDVFVQYGIDIIVPSQLEQTKINNIIFNELSRGIIKDNSRNQLINIINGYQIDGAILGCTELPLLIKPEHINVKLLNTLEIHVDAALKYALSNSLQIV